MTRNDEIGKRLEEYKDSASTCALDCYSSRSEDFVNACSDLAHLLAENERLEERIADLEAVRCCAADVWHASSESGSDLHDTDVMDDLAKALNALEVK